mmetsp:Transcript_4836/g.10439  ORF Transcript_4836/g.10439 Transcript_4836/m.10439 type:complete len:288 (+) Transcript_4836:341-1204(+)
MQLSGVYAGNVDHEANMVQVQCMCKLGLGNESHVGEMNTQLLPSQALANKVQIIKVSTALVLDGRSCEMTGSGLLGLDDLLELLMLCTTRHGLEKEGRRHRDGQYRRRHSERRRDGEVHQEGHQDDHVERQPVKVVNGGAHVLGHDVSLEGAHHREVEPHARFKNEEGHEAELDVLEEEHREVARRGHDHHHCSNLLHGECLREIGIHARAEKAEDHEAGEDVPKRRHWLASFHQARGPVEDEDEHGGLKGTTDEAAEQDLLVLHEGAEGLAEVAPGPPVVALAIVL